MAPFSRSQKGGPSGKANNYTPYHLQTEKDKSSPRASNDRGDSRAATSGTAHTRGLSVGEDGGPSLRSRLSPRQPPEGGFAAQQGSYPSPPAAGGRNLLAGWGRRKKRDSDENAADQQSPTPPRFVSPGDDRGYDGSAFSPPNAFAVPRYDSRGYPVREAPDIKVISPHTSEYGGGTAVGSPANGSPLHNRSPRNDDGGWSRNRPMYPPVPGAHARERESGYSSAYSESSSPPRTPTKTKGFRPPSFSDTGHSSENMHMPYAGGISPSASLFGDSTHSVNTMHSSTSTMPFGRADVMGRNFNGFQHRGDKFGQSREHLEKRGLDSPTGSEVSFGMAVYNGRPFFMPFLDNPDAFLNLPDEDDDDLHDPRGPQKPQAGFFRSMVTRRGFLNVGCLLVLVAIIVTLFLVYPVITFYNDAHLGMDAGMNVTGQLPIMRGPIDVDTPSDAYTRKSLETGKDWKLVFSDEFNKDGRTFYPGDDPYWAAEDYHYWVTNNLEWYSPNQLTTRNGSLVITLTDIKKNGLNYTGGLMTTWNRFCFTGGYVETAVSLPGVNNVNGLWPAVWTMGNLGRAGYGATTEGTWPYSYDSCDVGTLHNQSLNGVPSFPKDDGDQYHDGALSYLPGQRLSACTCPGDPNHPGPVKDDGTFVGRAAPEIDIIEAQVPDDTLIGEVSQSGQWAPFNAGYRWINTSETFSIWNTSKTHINKYQGSVWQQSTSGVTLTDPQCYTGPGMGGCFDTYGAEWMPGEGDDAYITWMSSGKKAWSVRQTALAPNKEAGVGQRLVAREPMYLLVNLGLSENFGAIAYDKLKKLWPVEMHVDYIRVYQDPDHENIGCDPPGYPTTDYIEKHKELYYNPNLTTFTQAMEFNSNLSLPKNRLIDQC